MHAALFLRLSGIAKCTFKKIGGRNYDYESGGLLKLKL
jgi:hypothetical protein